jgi:signal transduction histidine kinase
VRQIATLLEAHRLQLVPDAPGEARTGWVLVTYARTGLGEAGSGPRNGPWPLRPLAAFAAEMRRLVQQASYVDTLQAEIAAHERARIGRDLHDSAVQPYLGLKFAIDVVAQRCAADNPLHAQVQDLRQFCETELNELRDTVAVLRNGDLRGDNSLVPALRRQAKRFATLFGIETTLDVPDALVASRALSGAVLHMVNEALNNVRRHTKAKNVRVQLTLEPALLHLVVRDDAGQRSGFPAPSFHPRSLSERARELGGSLELRRHNGLDTEIHIVIPM